MTVNTAGGATLYIGTSAIPANIDDLTDMQALAEFQADSYIEVGEIEDLGDFGDESEAITFTALKNSRTRKFKGPRDAGTMAIVVGDDPTDDGQAAMVAAEAQPLDYNFKVVLNDKLTLGGTPSESYFYGKVMSKRKNVGNVSNVV